MKNKHIISIALLFLFVMSTPLILAGNFICGGDNQLKIMCEESTQQINQDNGIKVSEENKLTDFLDIVFYCVCALIVVLIIVYIIIKRKRMR